ncbi:MAG: MFS transporter [Pediococcus parvulus]|jgi:DHA1 family inner membrane transport protein|uniref:MFS transporter n=1 Tax=Pediococcus parvulus TaxID=54062 RepID=UPI0021A3DA2D|nr:MFS transporter [Pediococcus parvulus]MCT3030293.1 MFS transporter [Pediococcus parvulus]
MTEKQTQHATLILWSLAISAFAIGSTEFISVGLLPLLVSQFKISLAMASLTVSGYAFGVMIGAPVLTILTARWNRHTLMVGIMVVFILGNLMAASAQNFAWLLVGRLIAAVIHGLFMSVSSVIAADVVAPSKRASAIALMFTGLTVATVTGVPLGTFVGQHFGWRFSFLFLALIGLVSLLATWILIPRNLPVGRPIQIKNIGRLIFDKKILLALLLTIFGYGSTFTSYTYISPIMTRLMHFQPSTVVIILIVYGLMVAIGNTVDGRFANQTPLTGLLWMFTLLTVTQLFLGVFISFKWMGLLMVLLLGLFAFMNVPGEQLVIVQLAEQDHPEDIGLASALNISAFNIGIMIGSGLGSQIVETTGLAMTPYAGVLMGILAIGLTWLLKRATK